MLVPVINHATSILGGFAIFSVIGFIAQETGHSVDEVIKSGKSARKMLHFDSFL